jgi:hypothetical protein
MPPAPAGPLQSLHFQLFSVVSRPGGFDPAEKLVGGDLTAHQFLF